MTRLCVYLIFFFSAFPIYAQFSNTINFVHIGLEQGLSQSTILDIVQDDRGNMWFATYDGLNKYDGYTFTVYQHNENYTASISGDIIRTLKIDSQKRLWAGTEEGLSLYASGKDHFVNFYPIKDEHIPIIDIEEINSEELLICTEKGIFLFNTESHTFSVDKLPTSLVSLSATCLKREGDNVYIGTPRQGVFIYSISGNTLKSFPIPQLRGTEILAILQQSSTRLWVATEGKGLFRINPQTLATNIYRKRGEHQLSSDYVRVLATDQQNQLWVGTFTALNIYNEEKDTFTTYDRDLQKQTSLSQTSVRSIFMDSQGGMWVGTYFGGLNYYHPLKSCFQNIRYMSERNSLNDNVITCIIEDKQKGLWIGTNGGGVNHYNKETNTFTHYTQKEGLGSNDIKTIYIDETKNLVYIGTHAGGISILHRHSKRIETYNSNIKHAYSIVPANNGDLWISTLDSIVRFNPHKKTFITYATDQDKKAIKTNHITTIFRDSEQHLWLCGEKGISTYIEIGDELKSILLLPEGSSVNHNFINSIYESHNGLFWISTRSGLYRYDINKKEFKQYTTANGLPNNIVHGVLEDSYGELWISTNKGLSRFQPQTEKIRNYTDNDGLQSNQFTNNSFCHTENGEMYFGGINGITTFHPDQLMDNPYTPPVVIKRLRLFNKTVLPGDDSGILQKNINITESITLTAAQSVFSLEFVVSNYISGNHNTFAYKLDGYDKEWYYSDILRTVSYSNLPHGTYRFLVKASNNNGKWNEKPTELEIIILPVWYKTWWAILLFGFVLIMIFTFIFRYFWMRKNMKMQLQMERMDKEKQKEVNEMKLRFFINISHELRTPLTLILAPLQEIMDKVSDRWIHKQLEHIQRNTNRLLHLVNQLMDYRRAELGVFNLKVKYNIIHQTIEESFLFYQKMAQYKKIDYNFYSEVEGQNILCDPSYLELITNNLLSNAFKYTGEGKSIIITLKEENDMLLLQVKDTGSGIPNDKQERIFERFYQVDNEHLGSGIGLSLVQRLVDLHHGRIELESQEGVGSGFSVFLPTDESVYKPEEKATEQETEVHTTNNQDMYITDTGDIQEKEDITETNKNNKESILIVEDNIDILQYLSDELGKNYQILKAQNGEEAIAIIKEQEVDLVLTDIMMPVMDGIQLCKLIKQNLRTCHILVIILSAKTDFKEQLEGLQVGADDYIPKPFSLVMITTKIKNLFRTRHRAIEYYSKSLEIEPEKIALNPLDEDLLKKAVEVMEKHMDDAEFTTDEFAREMCMSRSNLHLKMKALTGESTNEFIRKMRFNYACKLLKEGKYTVSEISSMVGYVPSYFTTSFKKYFGCLPSEYGKNGKSNHSQT
nr:two-component regulator propeller domain-containing protein [Bacteroides intestinalis]